MSTERFVQLVQQHRELLAMVDSLFLRLDGESEEGRRRKLGRELTELLRALQEHFQVEASSTLLLTREQLAADRHAELLQLDAEHPELLQAFQEALTLLESRTTTVEEVRSLTMRAAQRFRNHEAREDALFRPELDETEDV